MSAVVASVNFSRHSQYLIRVAPATGDPLFLPINSVGITRLESGETLIRVPGFPPIITTQGVLTIANNLAAAQSAPVP
jgi:hypothetical protein